ncbi:CdaR family protein [Sorangium sp. So ce1078]|uniref:CdaR family protein n=1 Tax=Sorangium sp. So ce1078 TaxID=3133329 RepID=UPI003F601601
MTLAGIREALRSALFDNLGLKLLSITFALCLYAFIHGAENAQRTLMLRVVSILPPESSNRQLMTQVPDAVAVTVRGPRTQLDDLRTESLGTLRLDLRNGAVTHIDLESSMFHVPAGLVVEQIYPSTIELRWDDVGVRAIPVHVPRTGDAAQGFLVKGMISVEPPTVNARGPRSVVDVMQLARTAPFDISGLTEGTYQRQLALERPPKLVTYDVDSVMATLEIGRELATRTFDRKVEVVGIPRATVSPAVVQVRITGTPEDVSAVNPDSIMARVEPKAAQLDLSQPGSDFLDVLVDVPRVTAEVNPAKVMVKW